MIHKRIIKKSMAATVLAVMLCAAMACAGLESGEANSAGNIETSIVEDIELNESMEEDAESSENAGKEEFATLQPIEDDLDGNDAHTQQWEETIAVMEEYLPNTTWAFGQLPTAVDVLDYTSGDIGNDGVSDIAVIMESRDWEHFSDDELAKQWAVLVFTETEEGYQCTAISRSIMDDYRHHIRWGNKFERSVTIEDGLLKTAYTCFYGNYKYNSESWKYEFALSEGQLIVKTHTREYANYHTRCGLMDVLDLAAGEMKEYAYSMQEDGFEPWLVGSAECEAKVTTFDRATRYIMPNQSVLEYTEDGAGYDYGKLNLDSVYEAVAGEPWKVAYLNFMEGMHKDIYEELHHRDEFLYRFIYVNGDDIPELVINTPGSYLTIITYAPGTEYCGVENVSVLMVSWPYGAGGNGGYYYLPYENVFKNYDSDYAGGAGSTWYGKIDGSYALADKCNLYWKLSDLDDENSPIIYTVNSKEVSEAVYDSYRIEGEFEYISGKFYAYEIIEQMLEL